MSSDTLDVRHVPLDSLHLDPANARAHGTRNMEAIRASLVRFGQAEPLIVQKQTGRVIGGTGRLIAMEELGWTECDVVELDLDDLQAASLAIALNRTGELAEWDEPVLARLLTELREQDALEGVGFANDEIDELLAQLRDEEGCAEVEDPGPAEPPEQPVTKPGDLWILGDHRLLCGDSTSADNVTRLLDGDTAALMATDPPYCVDYTGADRPQDQGGKDWSATYREVDIPDLGDFLRAVFQATLPHLKADAGIYVWHAHMKYPVLDRVFEECGLLRHQVITWVKPSSPISFAFYQWQHEPCLFGWRKGHKPPRHLPHGPEQSTVWEVDWEGKQRIVGNEHPTQKPVRLFEIPMEMHTRPGAVVLEPFCGSGSQLIAAEKLGRRCRAMELEPAFVDVALRRWETATGKGATLEGTGQAFAEVAAGASSA